MKIVFISDTHGAHRKLTLPKGDILVHAGDLINVCGKNEIAQMAQIKDVDDWFGEQDFEKVICIAGNHDKPFEKGLINTMSNAVYLENEHYEYKGIKFFGSPTQLPFFGCFNSGEEALADIYNQIDDVDILITHGPPFGILDTPSRGDNAGSMALTSAVDRIRPKVSVFGHIHDSYGSEVRDGVQYFNASMAGRRHEDMVHLPWEFEI